MNHNKILRRTFLIVGATAMVLIVGLYTNLIRLPFQIAIHAIYPVDFSDNRILLGSSHGVFVGKVIRQVGNKERDVGPETQFEVEVILNVKGDLRGTVIVNQQGGYKNGVLYLVQSGDITAPADSGASRRTHHLLQPGWTYLLATRYNDKDGWYTLNSHENASKIISDNDKLATSQLAVLAENDGKVKDFFVAYPNEILLESDIARNTTHNNYQSLSMAEKIAIQSRVSSFTALSPSLFNATATPSSTSQ